MFNLMEILRLVRLIKTEFQAGNYLAALSALGELFQIIGGGGGLVFGTTAADEDLWAEIEEEEKTFKKEQKVTHQADPSGNPALVLVIIQGVLAVLEFLRNRRNP